MEAEVEDSLLLLRLVSWLFPTLCVWYVVSVGVATEEEELSLYCWLVMFIGELYMGYAGLGVWPKGEAWLIPVKGLGLRGTTAAAAGELVPLADCSLVDWYCPLSVLELAFSR